ncbi:MAG TPA: hypothetical protein VGM62_18260 [Chthoniobacterales bacterium]|jgi:hypothetical protein
MPLTSSTPTSRTKAKTASSQKQKHEKSEYIIGEINAFIAIRDELLAEVEEAKSTSKLHSLLVANNFVETCLTPARSPYDVQFLPEPDAKRERKRCEQVKRRVADLQESLIVR